jgi:hypothetical protein
VFQRPAPDDAFFRSLWQLLPDSTRCELWPASFAFGNDHGFHAVAMPNLPDESSGTLTEQQVLDYPQGRYELYLQIAIEDGDQTAVDRQFARRSGRETIRLAVILIGVMMLLGLAMKLLNAVP